MTAPANDNAAKRDAGLRRMLATPGLGKGGKKPEAPGPEPAFEPAPDAWERFEKAMDKVVKAPPQHRSGRALESRGAPATPRKGKG